MGTLFTVTSVLVMVKWQISYPDIALQTRAQKEKKKVGPTKAEIVTKFLDELKEDSGRKKYTLNDLGWVHQLQSSWCDLKSDFIKSCWICN